VPNWREIDNSLEWRQWLAGHHDLSNCTRQQLLSDALARGDAARVARFFRDFRSRTQPRNDRTRSKLPSAANAKRRNLEWALDRAVPNWRELNNDPQWLAYLGQTHTFSNCSRQTHLDEAVASGSVHRVIAFFKDFLALKSATTRPAPPPPRVAARQTYLQPQRHRQCFARLHERRVQGS
jgi:hypothetical protein